MLLTPRNRYLSQGCITIPVPRFSNPICLNPIFESPKRASTMYGVTQIITHVLIVYREAEPFHDLVLIDLKSVGQREIVLRFHNVSRNANRIMLPFGEVFEGFVLLSST